MRLVSTIFAMFILGVSSFGQTSQPMPMPMPSSQSNPDKAGQQPPPQSQKDKTPDQTQKASMPPGMKMEGMQMPGMSMSPPATLIESIEAHDTAGTSAEPISTDHPMLMTTRGKWMLMFHGSAFLSDIQQSGPRGGDKFFSTNWFMPMAQRKFSNGGQLTLRAMLSLEPATVTGRFYPELFQQGETAFGRPINDGQHPHDLFMELAALYDQRIGEKTLLSFYVAPMGDPAMGPAAFPHRASASEDPLATLGHHMQDSTHIAADVLTVGVTHRAVRLEASGFHGREPDENRWDIESGRIDSWSTRLTVDPTKNWSAQYSFAKLTSPEVIHPDEDIRRMTASVMYHRAVHRGDWSSSLIWGRNFVEPTGLILNSYLLESTLRFADRNHVWTRIENADRTNELLLGHNIEPPGFQETSIGRVQAYSFGYDREVGHIPHLSTAVGVQATSYGVPDNLKTVYGSNPLGVVMFVRFRPIGKEK